MTLIILPVGVPLPCPDGGVFPGGLVWESWMRHIYLAPDAEAWYQAARAQLDAQLPEDPGLGEPPTVLFDARCTVGSNHHEAAPVLLRLASLVRNRGAISQYWAYTDWHVYGSLVPLVSLRTGKRGKPLLRPDVVDVWLPPVHIELPLSQWQHDGGFGWVPDWAPAPAPLRLSR